MFTSKNKDDSCRDGCCSVKPKGKENCPLCDTEAKGVLVKTLQALLKKESQAKLDDLEGYHFCKTTECKAVYFKGKSVLSQEDMDVVVGCKVGATPATVCYCFDWTREKMKAEIVEVGETKASEDITAKMENPGCACETLNPSGACCLGDVSKAVKQIKKELEND